MTKEEAIKYYTKMLEYDKEKAQSSLVMLRKISIAINNYNLIFSIIPFYFSKHY